VLFIAKISPNFSTVTPYLFPTSTDRREVTVPGAISFSSAEVISVQAIDTDMINVMMA